MSAPRLRPELEIREQTFGDGVSTVVKDPEQNKFYRFSGASARLLKALDGQNSVEQIQKLLETEYGTEMPASKLHSFLEQLGTLGLLAENGDRKTGPPVQGRGRRFEDILYVKLKAFNPQRIFSFLLPKISFVFTRPFLYGSLALMAAALYTSLGYWNDLSSGLLGLFELANLPLVLLVAFVVITVHEFAHGLTCEHFGGRVHEIGFLLMYFQPCFYCDVSDSWLLAKRQRLAVMLAGSYSTLLLWALATLVWRVAAPETVLSRLSLVAIGFTGLGTLANFNPLIKLDGYYMLSDYLEIPNLRSHAFAYLGAFAGDPVKGVNRREKKIYLGYGVSALLYSLALFLGSLWLAAAFLTSRWQFSGLVLFLVLTLLLLRTRRKDALGAVEKIVNGTARRLILPHPQRKLLAGLALCALTVMALAWIPWELKVAGPFKVLPVEELTITPQVDGKLAEIDVDEGERVSKGQLIARLFNFDKIKEYEEIRGELERRRAELDLLRSGPRQEEVERFQKVVAKKEVELVQSQNLKAQQELLEATVEKRKAELDYAQKTFQRTWQLYRDGLIARSDMERDEENLTLRRKALEEASRELELLLETKGNQIDVRSKEVDEARSGLKLLLAGHRREEIRAAEAVVGMLGRKLESIELELESAEIFAPIDGIVITPHLKERRGQYIKKGEVLCKIAASDQELIIEMPVPEKEIADVAARYPVVVKASGYPRRTFFGKVSFIAPAAAPDGNQNVVIVKSRVDNREKLLKPGMTGFAKIYSGPRSVLSLMTRRAVRWLRTEFWYWLP